MIKYRSPIPKVACAEWMNVFRWMDGQEDWQQPRHVKHGLDELARMELKSANQILNRCAPPPPPPKQRRVSNPVTGGSADIRRSKTMQQTVLTTLDLQQKMLLYEYSGVGNCTPLTMD